MCNDRNTRRYLSRDPRLAVEKLFELGRISEDELEDANDLQEKIGHPLALASRAGFRWKRIFWPAKARVSLEPRRAPTYHRALAVETR